MHCGILSKTFGNLQKRQFPRGFRTVSRWFPQLRKLCLSYFWQGFRIVSMIVFHMWFQYVSHGLINQFPNGFHIILNAVSEQFQNGFHDKFCFTMNNVQANILCFNMESASYLSNLILSMKHFSQYIAFIAGYDRSIHQITDTYIVLYN